MDDKNSGISLLHSCPFCSKDVQEMAFYETTDFLAIYNIAPILPGHSMIITRNHITSAMQLSDKQLADLMIFARKTTGFLLAEFSSAAFDWSLQDGEAAGQSVPHFHLHIIPRRPNDFPDDNEWYEKLPENESALLDSRMRNRIDEDKYQQISSYLRKKAETVFNF